MCVGGGIRVIDFRTTTSCQEIDFIQHLIRAVRTAGASFAGHFQSTLTAHISLCEDHPLSTWLMARQKCEHACHDTGEEQGPEASPQGADLCQQSQDRALPITDSLSRGLPSSHATWRAVTERARGEQSITSVLQSRGIS